MKVAFVVQRYGDRFVGGAERFVRSLATGLAADGHQTSVLTSCAVSYADWHDEYEPGETLDGGVRVIRAPVAAPRDSERFLPLHLRASLVGEPPLWPWAQDRWSHLMGPDLAEGRARVAELAATHDVTVLVGYHYSHALRLTEVAAAHGPTVVAPTAHPEGPFHVDWVGRMFQHADRILCLAPEEGRLIADLYGRSDRIDVVGCPVDDIAPPSPEARRSVLQRYGLEDGRFGLVVGRIDVAKGSIDASQFAGRFRERLDPDFVLAVVGSGETDQVADDWVVPTGFVSEDDKNALLASCAFLIQPSYMESFSLALMEGWLLERPALVQERSRVLAGHVRRSQAGLLYRDYDGFEVAAATMLRRPDLADRLGRDGRRYVLEQYNWPRVSESLLTMLEHAADDGKARLSRRSLLA